MRQIPREQMDKLKVALLDALIHNTNVAGLKIVPPKVDEYDLEHAAILALMALTKDWVRPDTVQFINGDQRF